jgi:hypothetical protein
VGHDALPWHFRFGDEFANATLLIVCLTSIVTFGAGVVLTGAGLLGFLASSAGAALLLFQGGVWRGVRAGGGGRCKAVKKDCRQEE